MVTSTGTIVFSLDAELSWGYHDIQQPSWLSNSRVAWRQVQSLFDQYDIPATWAVVGHLFLENCCGEHNSGQYPDGWFDADPGTNESANPTWYGSELVDNLVSSSTGHEIGCHTFSHVEAGSDDISKDLFRHELETCVNLADKIGLSFDTFVYPRHNIQYTDILSEYGFTAYRGTANPRWYEGTSIYKPGKFMTYLLNVTSPPLSQPRIEGDLVNVPSSFYIFSFEGMAHKITNILQDRTLSQCLKGIRRAIATEGTFHIRMHPNDFKYEYHFERLESILLYVSEMMSHNRLDVKTIGEMSEMVRNEES